MQQTASFYLLSLLVIAFGFKSEVEGRLFDQHRHEQLVEHSRNFIHQLLHSLDHNPNETIVDKHFPESGDLLRRQSPKLDQCYNAKIVDGVRMSIFEHPMGKIVHEFLHGKNLTHSAGHSDETVASKATNVLHSLKTIAGHIHNCVRNQEPSFKPTQFGLTHFATMSAEEIRSTYQQPLKIKSSKNKNSTASGGRAALGSTGGNQTGRASLGGSQQPSLAVSMGISQEDLYKQYPATYDYRDQGVVSEVKNQGACGFCFVFGPVAAMESALMLKTGQRGVTLSEMDLIDCMVAHELYKPTDDKEYHVTSCSNGATPGSVFTEASITGLTSTASGRPYVPHVEKWEPYPYQIDRCGADPVVAKVINYGHLFKVQADDEQMLKAVLIKHGPVAVFLRTALAEDKYKSSQELGGFFLLRDRLNTACDDSHTASHVVLVVGWDEEYWIIKNSYGNAHVQGRNNWENPWGIEGYLYLRKEVATSCAIFGEGSSWYFPFMEANRESEPSEDIWWEVQPSDNSGGGGGQSYGQYGQYGQYSPYGYPMQTFWSYTSSNYPQLQNTESRRAALYPWLQNPSYDWRSAPSNPESNYIFSQISNMVPADDDVAFQVVDRFDDMESQWNG